jgi:hypothetical protein
MCHLARLQRDRPSEVAEGLHTDSVDSSLAQVGQFDRTGLPTAGRTAPIGSSDRPPVSA